MAAVRVVVVGYVMLCFCFGSVVRASVRGLSGFMDDGFSSAAANHLSCSAAAAAMSAMLLYCVAFGGSTTVLYGGSSSCNQKAPQ